MELTPDCLCRGDQKVFILLSGIPGPEAAARAHDLKRNANVPVILMPFDGTSQWVAVLPDIPEAEIEFEMRAANGDTGSFRYTSQQAIWRSRLNYRTKAQLCAAIRNYDHRRIGFALDSWPYQAIARWSPDGVHLRLIVTSPDSADAPSVRIRTLGLEPWGSNPVSMGLRSVPNPSIEGANLSQAIYSIEGTRTAGSLLVEMESATDPALNSFRLIDREELGRIETDTFNLLYRTAQVDPYYAEWFSHHRASEGTLALQRAADPTDGPLFSLVVPLYKTPIRLFCEMCDSVVAQTYPRWELVLVNASPEDDGLSRAVEQAAQNDSRIKVVTLPENLGISENTNAGIAAATGDFIGFFDHDDLIEPNLLFEYAKAIGKNPDTDVLYCDEDKLFDDGSLGEPYLKTCFSIDLLRSNNYICHLLCIRKTLLDKLPPITRELDGAQDHAMVLAASEQARHIHHVARVLYHWRAMPGSTAADASAKDYASDAGVRAVKAHLKRLGIPASVDKGEFPFSYHVRYAVPSPAPHVTIVIPSKDHTDVLDQCVASIFEKTTYPAFDVLVVDNGSSEDKTFALYERLATEHSGSFSTVAAPGPFNFSHLVNVGVAQAQGSYVVLLNNDTEVIDGEWLKELVGTCSREDVGACGVKLLYPDGTVQHGGGFIRDTEAQHYGINVDGGESGYFHLLSLPQDMSLVTAACVMVRKDRWEQVGGFDEEHLSVAYNDVDFCLRLREQGLLVVYLPQVRLYHHESLSRGASDDEEKQVRSERELSWLRYRHPRYFAIGDPYVNRNFSRDPLRCAYRDF
ncbi:glycosyltransferase family 2 protein [Atopobiaceae bacterium 24-176]